MRFSLKLRLRWIYWRQNHTIRWQKMSIELLKGRLMNVSGMIFYQDLGQSRRQTGRPALFSYFISGAGTVLTPPLLLLGAANRTGLHISLWAMKYDCVDSHNWSQAPPIKPQYLRLALVLPEHHQVIQSYLIMVEGNFLNSPKMILCPSWLVERFPHKCCQYSHFSLLKKPRISKSDNLGIFTTVSNFAV